ncbi:DUF3268 family zinc-finger domain-containing protein [Bradyrhizobium barranii]|uniref:DUF3268 family zinc-finger domain-containing protein n=1 Tax=Bradyrhizobium barranii TaxID=2992140 RepID=A0ABY3QZ53_9BRAD|nr:DUF3268 family zinc-finger domain-containing protein [Bradyrhizobium japonicum]UFW90995.1 DUF3268 family zinc-finger domain-containing protein [Bradyrhizobium japonicum]
MKDLEQARQRAQEAFDALWQPGEQRRTLSRDKALYWLAIALGVKPGLINIDHANEAALRKIERACIAAHGPAAFNLASERRRV